MNPANGNRDRLREVGLVPDNPLPSGHEEFIAELSEEEVDVLCRLKERLDERGIPTFTLAKAMPIL
jgi:hypothetical protein